MKTNKMYTFYLILFSINTHLHTIHLIFIYILGSTFLTQLVNGGDWQKTQRYFIIKIKPVAQAEVGKSGLRCPQRCTSPTIKCTAPTIINSLGDMTTVITQCYPRNDSLIALPIASRPFFL